MITSQQKIQHIYLRATFGLPPHEIKSKINSPINKLVDALFTQSKSFRALNYLEDPVDGKNVSDFRVLAMILKSREQMQQMDIEWLKLMTETTAQLREKMTFFWHNHFSTSTTFAWLMQVQNNMLRKNALGKFSTLLHAVAKDPAMIIYLNNQQNKKDNPNENFAREVMELFTLGVGNYTEKDIKEAARAFTGWTVNKKGQYEFVADQHDFNEKEFLGRKGNFNGEDIINILLEQKQTAKHITQKIYKEFVNEDIDEATINELADAFYKNDYDITKLLRAVYTSDWFYDEKNIGCKICSPVEMIVRYKKLIGFDIKDDRGILNFQKVLGQVLFFPPNVAGWTGGKNWIDSSSLLLRMNLPERIINRGGFELQPKPEFEDVSDHDTMIKTKRRANIQSDWSAIVQHFSKTKKEELVDEVINSFIQSSKDRIDRTIIEKNTDNSSNEKRIISTCAAVMSLPEFQLI